jgi:hypothetical protein
MSVKSLKGIKSRMLPKKKVSSNFAHLLVNNRSSSSRYQHKIGRLPDFFACFISSASNFKTSAHQQLHLELISCTIGGIKIGGDAARALLPQTPTFPLEEQSIMVANAAPYSSKIIRAGALLPDTKLLLAHWNLSDDVEANLRRIQQENLFGKASRSRVAEILAIFKQRYLGPRIAQRDVSCSEQA